LSRRRRHHRAPPTKIDMEESIGVCNARPRAAAPWLSEQEARRGPVTRPERRVDPLQDAGYRAFPTVRIAVAASACGTGSGTRRTAHGRSPRLIEGFYMALAGPSWRFWGATELATVGDAIGLAAFPLLAASLTDGPTAGGPGCGCPCPGC
jgi:hypothetical protein